MRQSAAHWKTPTGATPTNQLTTIYRINYVDESIHRYPPTPAYSQSLGGEAPGTPQGEAVGQVFKPLGSRPASSLLIAGLPLLFLWASKSDVLAYSCTAALPSSSSRQLAGLPLLFLWASKSDVRHFAPPSNPPPRLQTLPSAFGLLLHRSLACVRREPGERALERAARAPMGFQKRR